MGGQPRRARIPPKSFGCSVFTRPSSISGKPVASCTGTTFTPAAFSCSAVPPVETISKPREARPRPRSARPSLSWTETSARGLHSDGEATGVGVTGGPFTGSTTAAFGWRLTSPRTSRQTASHVAAMAVTAREYAREPTPNTGER